MKKIIFCILLISVPLLLTAEENYDWLLEHHWWIEDGRELVDPTADFIYWNVAPRVIFRKLELPPGSNLYQERLRIELFTLMYQTDPRGKLILLESRFGTINFDVIFNKNLTSLSLIHNNFNYGRRDRVGQLTDKRFPLVGIWGTYPYISEYRLIDPTDCFYYMEIESEIPAWAVRRGTYLIKKTGENTFETVSAFPDGHMRLDIRSDGRILLTPLFTLPFGEVGLVAPLSIRHRFIHWEFD